jgi:hypothetical protein
LAIDSENETLCSQNALYNILRDLKFERLEKTYVQKVMLFTVAGAKQTRTIRATAELYERKPWRTAKKTRITISNFTTIVGL